MTEPRDVLAEALDRHWMDWNEAARTAVCSCGEWQFDAERDIVVGEHFAPFSRHVADAILAAMPKHLLVRKDDWERQMAEAIHDASPDCVHRPPFYACRVAARRRIEAHVHE